MWFVYGVKYATGFTNRTGADQVKFNSILPTYRNPVASNSGVDIPPAIRNGLLNLMDAENDKPTSASLHLGVKQLAVSGLVGMVVLAGCEKPAIQAPPPPIVQVMTTVTTNAVLQAEFIGQLDSPQNVQLRARVEAFLEAAPFEEGTEVEKGDLLFQLDREPFLERLAAARASYAEATAALEKYKRDVARLEPLAEKRAIPQQDLDNAVASVAVGQASVDAAQAAVDSATLDLSYCDVRAPVSGLIGAKEVSIGELVGKGEPTLLATISQLDPIWFYCNVSEVEYLQAERQIRESGRKIEEVPVTILLADGTEHSETGRWVFLDRAVNSTTGTLRARAEFANPDKLLRPGMFARGRMNLPAQPNSILIPQRAVMELQGNKFVWVVDAENKATQRPVTARSRLGGSWIIQSGLEPGETIIVEGQQKAREGAPVQPMTAEQMAQAAAGNPTSSTEQ